MSSRRQKDNNVNQGFQNIQQKADKSFRKVAVLPTSGLVSEAGGNYI